MGWCPDQELNLDMSFRKRLLYPFELSGQTGEPPRRHVGSYYGLVEGPGKEILLHQHVSTPERSRPRPIPFFLLPGGTGHRSIEAGAIRSGGNGWDQK